MKRILISSIILFLSIITFAMPVSATVDLSTAQSNVTPASINTFGSSIGTQTVYSGGCGDDGITTTSSNVVWSLDTSTGVLTISGVGNMKNYPYDPALKAIIKSVIIESGVTNISDFAFYKCSGLTSLTIPNSVTSIGGSAFWECTGLTSLTIPNGVTSIGQGAFKDCINISSLQLSENLTYLSNSIFDGCSGLTSLTIPPSVTSIGHYAFYNCVNLSSVTIPNSVTIIDRYSFDKTPWFTTLQNQATNGMVVINHILVDGQMVTGSITIPSGVFAISNDAFSNCKGITSLTIPDSVISIGYGAFRDCSGIASLTIPDSVATIGSSAFNGCSGIVSLTLGKNVTTIRGDAFDNLYQLTAIHWNATEVSDPTTTGYPLFLYAGSEASGITVTFGDNVKSIPAYAFYAPGWGYAPNLKSLTIGSHVTSIGKYAFYCCATLTSINFPGSLTSVGEYAFGNCTGLNTITIPDNVTTIGDYAFSEIPYLSDITIPFATTSIGPYTFQGRSSYFTIHGYEGSYAKSYANLYGINFSSLGNKNYGIIYKDGSSTLTLTPSQYAYYVGLDSLPTPTKTGYSFAGWYNNAGFSGNPVTSISSTQTGDLTLYAKWIPNYNITVNTGSGGVISPTSATVNYDGSQTFTITPNTGFEIKDVTVDGVSQGAISSYTFTNVKTTHTITAMFKQKITLSFTDVPTGCWYEKFVNDLVGKGILSGYKNNDGTYAFHPDNTITRAEFATILAKASGEDLTSYVNKTSFNDVDVNYWGAKYIEWAFQNHIVSGVGNGKYDPEANITRQEMAVMIYRFATAYQKENLPQKNAALTFTDNGSIASWAATAVLAMQQAGVINGIDNGNGSYRFEPGGNAQRSAAATMISIYLGL